MTKIIRPSASIRQNYNEIAELCRQTKAPVFLSQNGEVDLVVMDIDTYNKRESMLKLREELLLAEDMRTNGNMGYSINDVEERLEKRIKLTLSHG